MSGPIQKELFERDRILDALERTRQRLIEDATRIALSLAARAGTVTSVQVVEQMRLQGYSNDLDRFDRRWLGAVFRPGSGWRRAGWERTGSHGRPVSVWERSVP